MSRTKNKFNSPSEFDKKMLPNIHKEQLIREAKENPKDAGKKLGEEIIERILKKPLE